MKIAIVADNNSEVTQDEAKELGIYVLPIPFMINGQVFYEGIDLSHEDFYARMKERAEITTSQPSPKDVTEQWEQLLEDHDQVVYIPMSSGLSGSCQTALMLAEDYEGRVQMMNNQRISVTQRQSTLDARDLAERGWSGEQIREKLEAARFDSSIYITVGTLKYLKKGGRITPAAAALGTLLKIKPVLTIQGEKLDAFTKAGTMKQAKTIMLTALAHDLEDRLADPKAEHTYLQITRTCSEQAARELEETVKELYPGVPVFGAPLSLSIECHIGPGALAVAYTKKLKELEQVSEKKFVRKLRTFGMSMKVPLTTIIIDAALIPLFLEAGVMLGTFRQSQLDARFIEIQNQCIILSNKMTRSGYMTAKKKNNASLDSQMQTLSDVYNGRIVIVGSNFRVVTDTFNLATGKYYLSEGVIKCFKGENSSHCNKDMQYFAQTIPVYDTADAKAVSGVIVVTASTENVLSLTDKVVRKSHLFLVCMILLISVLGMAAARLLLRPFKKLQMSFDRVAQGNLDADITEETYRETRLLSQSVQKSLGKLKAVDRSRQEFVSNVSHELKTPITSIRVLADSLMGMEDVPVELYREFMTDISDEIDRENQIIEDLLMLVKMDKTAEDQMNIEQVNINGELELILKRLRPIAKRGNVELILESIREVTADVDKIKISLAITDLVENTIKYNRDSGMVRVTLGADHKYFYIKVADTGIGIPGDALEHIFERFFRVNKARSREVDDTGLGLAIAKNVIQMHHGIIDVESTVGEGTTFSVRIPLSYIPRQGAKP